MKPGWHGMESSSSVSHLSDGVAHLGNAFPAFPSGLIGVGLTRRAAFRLVGCVRFGFGAIYCAFCLILVQGFLSALYGKRACRVESLSRYGPVRRNKLALRVVEHSRAAAVSGSI
jgi:hypothetical protein